jgi:hypothetical protein
MLRIICMQYIRRNIWPKIRFFNICCRGALRLENIVIVISYKTRSGSTDTSVRTYTCYWLLRTSHAAAKSTLKSTYISHYQHSIFIPHITVRANCKYSTYLGEYWCWWPVLLHKLYLVRRTFTPGYGPIEVPVVAREHLQGTRYRAHGTGHRAQRRLWQVRWDNVENCSLCSSSLGKEGKREEREGGRDGGRYGKTEGG